MRAVSAKEDVASRRMPVGKHLHQLVLAIYEWMEERAWPHFQASGNSVSSMIWRRVEQ